jgi:hypothetical protein
MDCLREDSVAQLALEARRGDQVHTAAQYLLQVLFHREEGEQPDGSVELDQDVYITVGPSLIARYGAEQRQGLDAELGEVLHLDPE